VVIAYIRKEKDREREREREREGQKKGTENIIPRSNGKTYY